MDIETLYKGRENERITPIIASQIWNALGNTYWWLEIDGKLYAPAELIPNYHHFQTCKIGDIKQVDPHEKLSQMDTTLSELQKERDDFAARIEHFAKGFWY